MITHFDLRNLPPVLFLGRAGGFVQYPIFAQNMNRVKGLGNNGGRNNWWTISTYSGNSASFVYVNRHGCVNNSSTSYALGAPVCFRIS